MTDARLLLVAASAALLVLLAAAPAQAGSPGESTMEPYSSGFIGDYFVDCDRNRGGVCFPLDEAVTSVSVHVDDANGAGAYLAVDDPDGTTLESGYACNAGTVPVPDGAARLRVYTNGPAFESTGCNRLGTATSGTVTAFFR